MIRERPILIGFFSTEFIKHSQMRLLRKSTWITRSFSTCLRNVGIISHVDGGKTTTTERMLFYSGKSRNLGDVDEGNTVTDFLEEERERGITISSACVHFEWKSHQINLVDSPGHVDFSFEVERVLRVLDGAVTILDGVAGVESQTEHVWRQADRYSLPRIVYINKMDRTAASFERSLESLRKRFTSSIFVPVQVPLIENGRLTILDVLTGKHLRWCGEKGEVVQESDISCPKTETILSQAREKLVVSVSEYDESLLESFLDGSFVPSMIKPKLRELTLESKIVPVFCGSSLKNVGVQSLLDGICDYLPSPSELKPPTVEIVPLHESKSVKIDPEVIAFAFKVTVDIQSGPIVFLRVYKGTLRQKDVLSVSRIDRTSSTGPKVTKERVARLLQIHGNQWTEVSSIGEGSIGAIVGCRATRTGDTLSSYNPKGTVRLEGIKLPEQVFFTSIEAESTAKEGALMKALRSLELEDPSLCVVEDSQTGQILLKGMGELHLNILFNRLKKHFGVKGYLGPMQVAYRESISQSVRHHSELNTTTLNGPVHIEMDIEITPSDEDTVSIIIPSERFVKTPSYVLQAVKEGLANGAMVGPLRGLPLMNMRIELKSMRTIIEDTSEWKSGYFQCASQAVSGATFKGEPVLMEPVMRMEMIVDDVYIGDIMSDLSSKRSGSIVSVNTEYNTAQSRIEAIVALAQMVGYAEVNRSISQGTASYSLQLEGYRQVLQ